MAETDELYRRRSLILSWTPHLVLVRVGGDLEASVVGLGVGAVDVPKLDLNVLRGIGRQSEEKKPSIKVKLGQEEGQNGVMLSTVWV